MEYTRCGGSVKLLQESLNIFNMYSKEAAKDLLVQSTLLITVDNDTKQFAWALRQCDIKDLEEVFCDKSEFVI